MSSPTPHSTPQRPPGLSTRTLLIPILLSLGVLAAITYFTYEPGIFRQIYERLNLYLLGAAVGMVVARVLIGAYRLRFVSHQHLSFSSAIKGQLVWEFFSSVTPTVVGGAPVAAVYIASVQGITVGETTAFMLLTMILDQLWFALSIPLLFVASAWGIPVLPQAIGLVGRSMLTLFFVGLLSWIVLFAYATIIKPELLQKLILRVFRIRILQRFRERIQIEMELLRSRAAILRTQPPTFFLKGFLLSVANWMTRYLALLFLVWSVYPELPKLPFFLRTIAMMLTALVMPTPGGAGGVEGLYALFLGPLMPRGLVGPTLLMWRLLTYYTFIAVGLFLTTHQVNLTLKKRFLLKRSKQREPEESHDAST